MNGKFFGIYDSIDEKLLSNYMICFFCLYAKELCTSLLPKPIIKLTINYNLINIYVTLQ